MSSANINIDFYSDNQALKDEMKRLKERDADDRFGRLAVELSNVKEEDWANNWKQYFKPLKVGEKLLVKPSWEEYDGSDNRTILEVDPASSFGTGQHNTTKLCLELLEKAVNGHERILDLGCGSGILSIGGILLGVIEQLSKTYISTLWADAIVFGVLVIVLVVKPTGLLGKKISEKV